VHNVDEKTAESEAQSVGWGQKWPEK